jgi:hypothetical protein
VGWVKNEMQLAFTEHAIISTLLSHIPETDEEQLNGVVSLIVLLHHNLPLTETHKVSEYIISNISNPELKTRIAVAKLIQVCILSIPLVDKLLVDENPAVSCEVIQHLSLQKSQDKLLKIILQSYNKLPLPTQKAFAQHLEKLHTVLLPDSTAEDIVNIVRLNFTMWKDYPVEENPGLLIFWAGYLKVAANTQDTFNIQRSMSNFLLEQVRIAKVTPFPTCRKSANCYQSILFIFTTEHRESESFECDVMYLSRDVYSRYGSVSQY